MIRSVRILTNKNAVRFRFRKTTFGSLGQGVRFGGASKFFNAQNIFVGDYVFIGAECYFEAVSEIRIGSGCMFGPRVFCIAGSHNYNSVDLGALPYDNKQIDLPVVIEDNVWVGGNVSIAPGAHIGEGSVIGMGAIVAGEIPPFSVVLAEKGHVVKMRNEARYRELVDADCIYNKLYAGASFQLVAKEDNI